MMILPNASQEKRAQTPSLSCHVFSLERGVEILAHCNGRQLAKAGEPVGCDDKPGQRRVQGEQNILLDKRDGHKHGNGGSQEFGSFPEQLQCSCGMD